MPNPVFVGVMSFRQGSYTWKEQWYTDQWASSKDALTALENLRNVRDQGTGYNTTIWRCKVSNIAVRGDSRTKVFLRDVAANVSATDPTSDQPSSAYVFRVEATDVLRRSLFTRGMPDDWFKLADNNVDPDQPVSSAAAIDWGRRYLGALVAYKWGLLGYNPALDTGVRRALKLTLDGGNKGRLTVEPELGVPLPVVGDRIQFIGSAEDLRKIVRKDFVSKVSATTFGVYQLTPLPVPYKGNLKYRIVKRKVFVARSLEILYANSRKTASGVYGTRGAKSTNRRTLRTQ